MKWKTRRELRYKKRSQNKSFLNHFYLFTFLNRTRMTRIKPIYTDLILGSLIIRKPGKMNLKMCDLRIWNRVSISPRGIAGLRWYIPSRLLFTFTFYLFTFLSFILYPLSFSHLKTCQGQHWGSITPRGIAGLRIINPFTITFSYFLIFNFSILNTHISILFPLSLSPGSWFLVLGSRFKAHFLLFTFTFLLDFVLCPCHPDSCLLSPDSWFLIPNTQY